MKPLRLAAQSREPSPGHFLRDTQSTPSSVPVSLWRGLVPPHPPWVAHHAPLPGPSGQRLLFCLSKLTATSSTKPRESLPPMGPHIPHEPTSWAPKLPRHGVITDRGGLSPFSGTSLGPWITPCSSGVSVPLVFGLQVHVIKNSLDISGKIIKYYRNK